MLKTISLKENKEVDSILSDKSIQIHIIGGGGVGMSGLAALLSHLGYSVSASDQKDSSYLQNLSDKHQMRTWVGSNVTHLSNTSVIFYSTAIPESDLERQYAIKNGISIFSRHSLLSFLTKQFYTIAVCGTHGKTTTSSWLVHLFQVNKRKVYSLLGGTLQGSVAEYNMHVGTELVDKKPILIIEADESDGSLLYIDADILCVTNIEMDHPDVYRDVDEVYDFFRRVFEQHQFFLKKDIFISIELQDSKVQNFFFKKEITYSNFVQVLHIKDRSLVDLEKNQYTPQILGIHNLYNASLVVQLGFFFSFETKKIQHTVSTFLGSKRRMELLGSLCYKDLFTFSFLDDYAHHPNEIYYLISTLQERQDNIKYCFFWEPHRLSRLQYFSKDFMKVFSLLINFNDLYLLPPFRAGEKILDFLEVFNIIQCYLDLGACSTFDISDLRKEEQIEPIKEIRLLLDKVFLLNDRNTEISIVFIGAGRSSQLAQDLYYEYSLRFKTLTSSVSDTSFC